MNEGKLRSHTASYSFANRSLLSNVRFATLPEQPDVAELDEHRIVVAFASSKPKSPAEWVHHWCDVAGSIQISVARWDQAYWLRFPELCDFLVDVRRSRIELMPAPGLDLDTLEHLLVDQVLPRYLAGTGNLVVHASAVRVNGKAALFLGQSGWGKSTLAGLLRSGERRLLSDDCVILLPAQGELRAIATYASLRLFNDSMEVLGESVGTTLPLASYTEKRRLRVDSGPAERFNESVSVAAIYLLVDPQAGSGKHSIQPLSPIATCMGLIAHAFKLDPLDHVQVTRQLTQASNATGLVPAFLLDYPRDYASSQESVEFLLAHIHALDGRSDHVLE